MSGEAASDTDALAKRARREPTFVRTPRDPGRRRIFVSYAWNEPQPDGIASDDLVTALCECVKPHGIEVIRDKSHMKTGDLISEFVHQLADGELVIAVLSQKYLQSPYCMNELLEIFKRCGSRAKHFHSRVIVLVQPGVQISRGTERLGYAKYWMDEWNTLRELANELGSEFMGETTVQELRLMSDIAKNTDDMLGYIADSLTLRDLPELVERDFRDLFGLLGIDEGD